MIKDGRPPHLSSPPLMGLHNEGTPTLLLMLGAHRSQLLLGMVARRIRIPETLGRDPDPPSLIRLSIQRC